MRWSKLSLQVKIGIVMTPMILPVCVIVHLSHASGAGTSVTASNGMSALVVEQGAAQVGTHLEASRNRFLGWTAEDVYGMAIEFQTVQELGARLGEMVEGSQFASVVLTSLDGKVVTSAARKGFKAPAAGEPLVLPASAQAWKRGDIGLLDKGDVAAFGLPFPASFGMGMEVKDSSGKANGRLHAVLDWTPFTAALDGMTARARKVGFEHATSLLVRQGDGRILGRSGRAFDEEAVPAVATAGAGDGVEVRLGDEPCRGHAAAVAAGETALPITMVSVFTEAEVMAAANALLMQNLGLAGGAVVLLLVLGLGIGRWIAKPIRAAAQKLDSMSQGQGDLTARLPVNSEDELGALAAGFNRFVHGLGALILKIRHETEELGRGVQQVMDASQQTSTRSIAQAESINQIHQTTEQITGATNTNAEEARGARGASANAKQATERGRQAMTKMAKAITEVKDASSRANKIIEVIDGIAFQVNLLALNAAVEAARAGDAGRGFAVVAEEVRSLAQRSAKAARDSANVITECDQRAQGGVEIVAEVESVLSKIDEQVQKLDAAVAHIAESSQNQASGLTEVSANVSEMDSTTAQGAAQAEELAAAASESSTRVQSLKALVGTFRVDSDGDRQAAP